MSALDSNLRGLAFTGVRLRLPLVLLLAALLTACDEDAPKPQRPAPEVGVMTVSPRTLPTNISFVAQTESSQQVEIMARVSGFLDKIAYKEGAEVKEGDLLFQLDPKPFQAQLDAEEGKLRMQEARLRTAEAAYNRIKPLAKLNAVSQSDLDRATGDRDAAKAAVFAAMADVQQAELNLSYATIRSPVTGMASQSLQRQGAYINAASGDSKLTYVAALDPMWVNFSISQNQTNRIGALIQQGALTTLENKKYSVEITLSDGRVYEHAGSIDFLDPSYNLDTGAILVRAVIPNPRRALSPGMFVKAEIKGASRPDAVTVPQLAVQQGEKGHFVYVINPQDVAEVRPVVVGDYYGDALIIIEQGLHAGDRVAVNGMQKIQPGKPVKIVAPDAAPAAKPAAS